jgi:hypothetical protein
MRKRTKSVPEVTKVTESQWLHAMREHYAETGHYRPQDVRRVLGNPWDRVEVATKEDAHLMSRVVGQ